MDQSAVEAIDVRMMARCIELSRIAGDQGEFPFAAVIGKDGYILVEATNRVAREGDITRHAELLAISDAQRMLGRTGFAGCTLYSNVEPCAMCSFPIREARMSRVVFAMRSPLMGGVSKWNILADPGISNIMPERFGVVPEIVAGVLAREAEDVWRRWNPLIWAIIKRRGCFAAAEFGVERIQMRGSKRDHGFWRGFLTALASRM